MPHDHDEDSSFSESDLKALLLKSMPISWQHAYALKGTCSSDDYCHMLSYFVQYQSITDKSDNTSIAYACCQEIGIDFKRRALRSDSEKLESSS